MPALTACGRRWAVASDDFVFPALTELFFRSAWALVVFALLVIHSTSGGLNSTCSLDLRLDIFYFTMLGLYVCFILQSIFTAVVSSRGTIMDARPRRWLPYLLYIRLFLVFPEIILNVFGTIWLFNPSLDSENCNTFMTEAVPLARTIVVIIWLLLFGSLVLLFLIFDPLGREPVASLEDFQHQSSSVEVWERRCKWTCFCLAGSQADYREIGGMLAEYFTDTDLVATDIAAGLALLAAERQHDLDHKAHASHYAVDLIPNWMNLNNALHFMPYATAMYGWPFYLFREGCGGCCSLCGAFSGNCCLPAARNAPVLGDNCCRCNLATISQITNIPFEDIVTVELRNRLYEVPFMVCADRQKRVIVVAIRGTLSLADAVTDITARAESFSTDEIPVASREGSPEGSWYAHKGMLMAARWVVNRLVNEGVLRQAMETYHDCNQGIVVVGHSLGAGTAALVTLLLNYRQKDIGKNVDLRCFAYAPPGGLVSREINLKIAQEIICGITLADDLVPRLSLPNMLRLKNDLLKSLKRSRRPKYRIFGGVLCSQRCCVPESTSAYITEEGTAQDYHSLVPSSPDALLSDTPTTSPEDNVPTQRPVMRSLLAEPKMFPPGRMITINENILAEDDAHRYTATYCDPSKCFGNIIICLDMIRHHLPHSLHNALLDNPREVDSSSTVEQMSPSNSLVL